MIREVIEHYVGSSKGDKVCCPVHGETTPSLHIYDHNDTYYCFGACSTGGDVIKFVREVEQCSFQEAIDKIAEILDCTEKEVRQMMSEGKEESKKQVAEVGDNPRMSQEDTKAFLADKSYETGNYRSIRDEISKFFGHVVKKDASGNVVAQYYPETNNAGFLTGYKCRNHPKDFSYGKVGHTGIKSQLSGQVKFKGGGKYVLCVGGELDKAAAYQMLLDAQKERSQGEYNPIAVVSPTSGEGSAAKQCKMQYEFLDQYDIIVIGMDNDDAGRKAAEEIAKVLPQEKVRIATWSGKDPNAMLQQGKQKQFVREFYGARELVSTGFKDSSTMTNAMKEELLTPRIGLPDFLWRLEEAQGGGIRQKRIVNIIGDSSIGKSTLVNSLVYHWVFNAPEPVCVVSLEATEGQYALDLASIHLSKNLQWYDDGQDVVDFLDSEEVQSQLDILQYKEDGTPRYYIIDERDGSVENLEKQMERMYRQYGCRIFVIDVLSDLLRGSAEDKQEDHMAWQKRFIKEGATIINVLHTRKPPPSPDGKIRKVTEYDALGSGTFVQSAAVNIVINRNKMAEGIEQNITWVDMPKCRGGRRTGEICGILYDGPTRKLYDAEDYFIMHPEMKPVKKEKAVREF